MEDDNTKEDHDQPTTSKKESKKINSGDDTYNESRDGQATNSETSVSAYSIMSRLDMAGTGPNVPKIPTGKVDSKSHEKKKKQKRITGRVEKRKRPMTKRQVIRKAPKRKPRSKEKKYRDLSVSTIFTRLSSSGSLTLGCEHCGHRCCRRRYENEMRRYRNRKRRNMRRPRNMKGRRNIFKRNQYLKTSECIQAGSRSHMLSPLFITTNSSPSENYQLPLLHCEISPEMIQEALTYLTKWKQDIPTNEIMKFLILKLMKMLNLNSIRLELVKVWGIRNFPVNNDEQSLIIELMEKLRICSILGIIYRSSNDTWTLSNEFQNRKISENHVTLFWKAYGDTLKPVAKTDVERANSNQQKMDSETRRNIKTIATFDEDII